MAESNPLRGFPRLRRAATSFPGNLHLVLVLNPSSLLGSAPSPSSSTDLGFRFSQDDFLLKMPVVMLRSVGELLRYIDENHLTSDFTAKVEVCQSDWIVLRTSIETFAVTVKEIAQLLQGFGSELSETELPDESNAIEFLLHAHTQRYRQMKDDIRGVMKEGRLLLSNLQTVKATKRDAEEEREIQTDMDTVHRLLNQLRDMEEAFDGFFEKHHLKLQQFLQLLQYEISFQQMDEALEQVSAQEKGIASVGTTLVQTEQLLKDLEMLDGQAEEEMAHAQVLILHGHQLATNHHYALALIIQHCNELRHHCDVITNAIRTKRASLTRARDLLRRLEDALRWCDEGAYLLASQMVDKFQTKEGAQEALHYLSCHQERAPSAVKNNHDTLSLEFEAILTPQLQSQIAMVTEKLNSMQSMIRNREQCLRKLADVQVRPIQPVAPRPEPDQTSQRCKSNLFSPKHGVDLNVLNSKFSFDILPGKKAARRNNCQRKIEVMHDYQGNRSCLYGSNPETDSEVEDNPEQTYYKGADCYREDLCGRTSLCPSGLPGRNGGPICGLSPSCHSAQPEGRSVWQHARDLPVSQQDVSSRSAAMPGDAREGGGLLLTAEREVPGVRALLPKQASLRVAMETVLRFALLPGLPEEVGSQTGFGLLPPETSPTSHQIPAATQGLELLKHCTEARYRCELQEALDAMLELLKSVNDSMHQIAITGYQGDLSQLGRMVMQGSFSVWISHKRAAVRMKELARFKPMQRHLFLYDHALLFCKRRDEDNHDRTPFYSFKSCLRMSSVGITETVKGDVKKFEIWYSGREVVYIVQAPTVEVKVAWLTEIRKILTNQLKLGEGRPLPGSHVSDSASRVCVSWGGAPVGGCSACLPVPHSSSATSHSHRLRGEESEHSSPAHSDPVVHSPQRSWPVPAHTVAICEGLEDWGATDLSNLSDSDEDEEDQPTPLVAGRYRVMVESSMASTDDIIFNCGDVIQLLHEDSSGMWMVRNISRGEEGRVLPEDLHRILGETC
uniref:proto-oncogene DBL isoform X2 n=1 Tax=Solea senegalensis TaxID=28829 RepID=UPI001CD8351C|nr:proto-oncogene DBL isoform X2 [Solea senegalensis]